MVDLSAVKRLERRLNETKTEGSPEQTVRKAVQALVQLWQHPEHAAFVQHPYNRAAANPAITQLLQQSVDHLLQLSPAAFAEVHAQDVLHHCSGSAVLFADAKVAGTLGRLVVWLQQQHESTLGLLQESQSDAEDDEDDSDDDENGSEGAAAATADAGLKEAAAAAAAAGDGDLPLPVQLWYLCNKQLAQISRQLFMAMGRDGDKAVASITQQLVDTGLLNPSCPANAAATLTWLIANRPQHWRQLSEVLLLPVNNMLHAWSADRRADLPLALAELALPLLRVSQSIIEVVLQRNAAAEMRSRRWQLTWHLQESLAALAGNASSSSSSGGVASAGKIKEDVQAMSDGQVIAALRAERQRITGVLLSPEDRKLSCAALQCQEHILEAGSSPTGLFTGQTQQLLSCLASSDEFAAAAVQLLVPCCHNWFCMEEERRLEQQQERKRVTAAPAADGAAAASAKSSNGNSSSSRECLVPKKQLLPSEVLVAPAHKAYPIEMHRLATMFQDMSRAQHPVYGVCEVPDLQCVAQQALQQHILCRARQQQQQHQQQNQHQHQNQHQQQDASLESSPALSPLALQLTLQATLHAAASAEREQQQGLLQRKTYWKGNQRGPGPIPYQQLFRQCSQLWDMQSKCAGFESRYIAVQQAGEQVLALAGLQAQGSVWAGADDEGQKVEWTGGTVLNDLWCFGWNQQQQQQQQCGELQHHKDDQQQGTQAGDASTAAETAAATTAAAAVGDDDLVWLGQRKEQINRQLIRHQQAEQSPWDDVTLEGEVGLGLVPEKAIAAEAACVAADAPQLLLAHLAAANPATYFGVLDSSIRKEIDSGKLLQAAQLMRQGLGFYNSSSSGGLAAVQNPSLTAELLQDPAAVTALASAVACLTKLWVTAFQLTHQQGSSSSKVAGSGSSSSSSSNDVAPGSPEEFDFCVAATNRMLQLGLVSVLDWLLQLNTSQPQQQLQQQSSVDAGSDSTAAGRLGNGSNSTSTSTWQAAASSLFLLLVITRSALLTQQVMQTVAQQQQKQQQQASSGVPAVSNSRATAQPLAVLQESGEVLQEVYVKCMQLLACLQTSAAALPAPATAAVVAGTAAAAAADSSTVQPVVVWESLLQLQAWLPHSRSSSSQAVFPAAAAAAAVAAARGGSSISAAMEGCRQLVAALPLPELCNNLACSNLSGISEAAAAKKRCSGCKISRYCSVQCQQQHWLAGAAPWQQHKPACLQVKAARAAGMLQSR